jgi:hypothetical protein
MKKSYKNSKSYKNNNKVSLAKYVSSQTKKESFVSLASLIDGKKSKKASRKSGAIQLVDWLYQ